MLKVRIPTIGPAAFIIYWFPTKSHTARRSEYETSHLRSQDLSRWQDGAGGAGKCTVTEIRAPHSRQSAAALSGTTRRGATTTALVSTWAKGLHMSERQLQIGTQGPKLALILEIKIQTT
jgi:hypothetical protein